MARSSSAWCGSVLALVVSVGCAGRAAAPRSPAAAANDATPIEVARAFYAALHAGDAAGAGRLVANPNGTRATESFVAMARAYEQLENAVRDRFGADAAHAVGYRDRLDAEDEGMRVARETVSDDEATVTAGDHTLAALRRVDGRWRVALDDALTTEDGIAALALEAAASRAAAERVAPAVRGGLFDSADDAIEAFRDEVALRMQSAEPAPLAPGRAAGGTTL